MGLYTVKISLLYITYTACFSPGILRFLWKLVVDSNDDTAIGIVGVNNVHLTEEEAQSGEYRVCTEIEVWLTTQVLVLHVILFLFGAGSPVAV